MTDLDAKLRETLNRAGDAHAEQARRDLGRARAAIVARTRRRRAMRASLVALATAAALLVGVQAWPSDLFRDDAAPSPVNPGPGPGEDAVVATQTISLGNHPELAEQIAATDAGIFVTGNNFLHRIAYRDKQPRTLHETEPPLTCCTHLEGLGEILWRTVETQDGTRILERVALDRGQRVGGPAASVGNEGGSPEIVQLGSGAAWSYGPHEAMVYLVDPETSETIDGYDVEGLPDAGDAYGDRLFLALDVGEAHRIVRMEPGLGVAATSPGGFGPCLTDFSADISSLWVIDQCGDELVRLDPDTLEVEDRLRLPGEPSAVASGLGSVWVTLVEQQRVIRFFPEGEGFTSEPVKVGDEPVDIVFGRDSMWVANRGDSSVTRLTLLRKQLTEPEPEESSSQEDSKCVVDFSPTADGFESGPHHEEDGTLPGYLGTWGEPFKDGRRIDLYNAKWHFDQANTVPIEVLGGRARLGDIHEGYSVEFRYGGCDFVLHAYGQDRAGLRTFAESLQPIRAEEERGTYFASIYPENTRAATEEACIDQPDRDWRERPEDLVLQFAYDTLGWNEASVARAKDVFAPSNGHVYDLTTPDVDRGHVLVMAQEFVSDCWLISDVTMPEDHQNRPTGFSVSAQGRIIEVGYARYNAASFDVYVDYGGVAAGVEDTTDTFARVELPEDRNSTGSILVLYRNESGEVYGARSVFMPKGDFTAG